MVASRLLRACSLVGAGASIGYAFASYTNTERTLNKPAECKALTITSGSRSDDQVGFLPSPGASFVAKSERGNFAFQYNAQKRIPDWVFERLRPLQQSPENAIRKKCKFHEDRNVPELFRAFLADYKHSGFDRGHMAAAGNYSDDQREMCETFSLSNMVPQIDTVNRGIWQKLEQQARDLALKHSEVYVCSGPLFLPSLEANGENWVKYQVIGESHVAVPTHFFKIIVWGGSPLSVNRHGIKEDNDTSNNNSATNTPSTTNTNNDTSLMIACYLVPNSKTLDKNSRMQLVPIEVIERASGYRFFCRTDSPTLIAS
eukprot:m.104895 g.104895  ORF g.104895 m.104895 type:complete len:315 (+) comp27601_c0_seq2:173-1117(+)